MGDHVYDDMFMMIVMMVMMIIMMMTMMTMILVTMLRTSARCRSDSSHTLLSLSNLQTISSQPCKKWMRIIQINISDGDHVCLDDDGGERKEDLTTMCSQSVVMQWRLLWLLVTEALIVHGKSD